MRPPGQYSAPHSYSYIDKNVFDGQIYWYKIEEIAFDGTSIFHGPISVMGMNPVPDTYELTRNYPNPFNPETTIGYQLPEDSEIIINVYSLLGRKIKVLVNERKKAGYYSTVWDATDDTGRKVSSGVYLIIMQAKDFRQAYKMTLLQ